MAAKYVTRGFGQVEPNHLSAQRTAQIYAQLPADKDIEILENGMFVSYDYAAGKVTLPSTSAPITMVYNEVKVYGERETDADFAMKKVDYTARVFNAAGDAMPEGTTMVPRCFKMSIGDIYTTNCVDEDTLEVGDELGVAATGYLTKAGGVGTLKFKVAKVYTLADKQKAVKLQCIAE